MDLDELIAQLRSQDENARSMPMSASAVINRAEVLELIARLEQALPAAFADQQRLNAERDDVIEKAHAEAAEIVAAAERRQADLVGETDVFKVAKHEAEAVLERAVADADELRRETDDYVDTRLASFEVSLTKILEAVTRGRSRLQGRSAFDALGVTARGPDEPDPDNGADQLTTPDELKPDRAEQAH